MRFCVRRLDVCAGKEKRILRKSAFWPQALTERRILAAAPHAKAHSVIPERSYKLRFFVTPPLGRRGATARQAAGHYEKRLNWANALEQPPRQAAGRVAPRSETFGLEPDRILL